MMYLLDVLGSTIIGGFLLMMIIQFNMRVTDNAMEMLYSNLSQSEAVLSAQLFEFDLLKIGYGVTSGEMISKADSNAITFRADLENKGVIDSVSYRLGTKLQAGESTNPDDLPLFRKVNALPEMKLSNVGSFKMTYLDSTGAEINFGTLGNPAIRKNIKSIRVSIVIVAPEAINDVYPGAEIYRVVRPRNLNL